MAGLINNRRLGPFTSCVMQGWYSGWLLVGPWFAGTLLGDHPVGLVGLWGFILDTRGRFEPEDCKQLHDGLVWCPNVDVIFYVLPSYLLLHFPATLWLASALSTSSKQSQVPTKPPKGPALIQWAMHHPWLAMSMCWLLFLTVQFGIRIGGEISPMAAIFSPGITWSAPLAVALLAWARMEPVGNIIPSSKGD